MFKQARVLFFYTITPLHPGSGVSLGAVDLPIQRERHTNFPIIQASGVKGALRDLAKALKLDEEKIKIVFGPETEGASEHGGALALTDARVLLFPVRSVKGVFAWVTCPAVIARFMRDLEILQLTNNNKSSLDLRPLKAVAGIALQAQRQEVCVPKDSNVVLDDNHIIFEDFCFNIVDGKRGEVEELAKWLANNAFPEGLEHWKDKLKKDFVLLSDDDFREFVEMSTEVITRVKLGFKGTVEAGPWDEEHLPAETLLYSLALATEPKIQNQKISSAADVVKFLEEEVVNQAAIMQFGGDETVGKGLVKVKCFQGAKSSESGKEGRECR